MATTPDTAADITDVQSLAGQTIVAASSARDTKTERGKPFTRLDMQLEDGRTVRIDCRRLVILAPQATVI